MNPALVRYVLSPVLAAFLVAFLAATTFLSSGCAAVAAALPDVVAAVVDGAQILDAIEHFVGLYFAQHPDPPAQQRVGAAIARARSALQVALRTAQASQDARDGKVQAAFDEFRDAYLELVQMTRPYGVQATDVPSFRTAPGGERLLVPQPIALSRGTVRR